MHYTGELFPAAWQPANSRPSPQTKQGRCFLGPGGDCTRLGYSNIESQPGLKAKDQATRTVKKQQLTKTTTLHVPHRLFWTFPCRCFARLKCETSFKFLFTRFMEEIWRKCLCSCSLCFFTAAHFHFGSRQHFSCSYRRYIIFMIFFQRNWSPLLFISRSSSFPVIQVNVDIKIQWKERLGFFFVLFSLSLEVRAAMCDLLPKRARCLNYKLSPKLQHTPPSTG